MSIPSTFAPVGIQDFTMRPVDVHRRYNYSSSIFDTSASGYFLQEGYYRRAPTPIGSNLALNDPTNSSDGSYKHVIWKSLDQRYYRFPYDTYASFEHSNKMLTTKNLYQTASVLTMPYLDFGLRIKPGSLTITNSTLGNISCYDDGYGNLKMSTGNTGSLMNRSSLVGYWGFNDLFRHFSFNTGVLSDAELEYEAWSHSVDAPSQIKQVVVREGLPCTSIATGLAVTFESQGYIRTPHRDEFNFLDSTDFTISLWGNFPLSQSVVSTTVNDILTKNGVLFKTTYGIQESQLVEGSILLHKHYSSSFQNQTTNVFPYSIQIYNQTSAESGKILFKASNGSETVSLVSSTVVAGNAAFNHIAVTKSGSLYTLFINGTAEASSSANLGLCANEHCLMFGSKDMQFNQALSGSLDEIRIYEEAASPLGTLLSLYDDSGDTTNGIGLFQDPVVGNVFYRRGVVTITSLLPAFKNLMKEAWVIDYRGTHTIYQYEVLCRIRKGDFNLSMNPSARVHPKSDRLIDDFTGSLLKPYATSVGLYNDHHELVAIAKLGQPLKMRDDVDINISVQWDS